MHAMIPSPAHHIKQANERAQAGLNDGIDLLPLLSPEKYLTLRLVSENCGQKKTPFNVTFLGYS